MDKQKIIDIALWAIVAYAVTLLIYWTLKIFNQNAENISALGSLLSASATFFAAYVAVKLFNDWRDPANYATTKEQVLEALGVLSQVRYQLSFMLDNLYTLKKTNEFLVLNEEILNYSKNDIDQKFFEIVKNIKFLEDKPLFEEFGKINHHFMHSENFYISCIKEYKNYYDYLAELEILKGKEIFVAPYRAYRFYGLEIIDILPLYSLTNTLKYQVGYSYNDVSQQQEIKFNYDNTIVMLGTTIALIDSFELKLLDKIRV